MGTPNNKSHHHFYPFVLHLVQGSFEKAPSMLFSLWFFFSIQFMIDKVPKVVGSEGGGGGEQ